MVVRARARVDPLSRVTALALVGLALVRCQPAASKSAASEVSSRAAATVQFAPAASSSPRHPPAPYPAPDSTFTREQLHERVDGAADLLLADGCRNLWYWRLEQPPADLELLAFDSPRGPSKALDRDAGPDRSVRRLGEEASVSSQCVFFRRGPNYVRLIADEPTSIDLLVAQAERLDRALLAGPIRP